MAEIIWWEELGRFWERSTGGGDVAANLIPAESGQWPTAPRPAGIDTAVTWLTDGLNGSDLPRFVFLVGGPGAGKSHAAAAVVTQLNPLDPPSKLAARKYKYAAGDARLVVINDATITSDEYGSAPLASEMTAAVVDGDHFMACVNRGILVEESASLRRSKTGTKDLPGAAIVDWLQSGPIASGSSDARDGWAVEPVAGGRNYFRGGRLFDGDSEVAELVAVYVDVNSLFEVAPTVSLDSTAGIEIESSPYRVADFAKRMGSKQLLSPAGALFDEVIERLPSVETPGLVDPFYANLESLKVQGVRQGVTSVLRATEVVSSQRLTYREVWGALSRCVIGGVNARCNAQDLNSFVLSLQPLETDLPKARFQKIRALAEFRFSQSLFGSDCDASELERDPVLRLTHLVDPVRDAIPGTISDDQDLGWASPVADAFSGDRGNTSPLGTLLEAGRPDDSFSAVVSHFDRALDSAYVDFFQDAATDKERHEATAWYGAYLVRLYAVANGIPAFRREVSVWTSSWRLSPNLPKALEEQLTTLLKPVRYPEKSGGTPLFPIFESRTNPVRGDQSVPKLAIRSEVGKITSETESDSVFIAVAGGSSQPTRMLLDFAMVREAMACAHGHLGATELSDTTSPRLERFRAARLVPGRQASTSDYRVVSANDDSALAVETFV